MGRRERACNHCGFPARKGVLPIIHPGSTSECKPYCSVACFEAVAGRPIPEPHRAWHLEVEATDG